MTQRRQVPQNHQKVRLPQAAPTRRRQWIHRIYNSLILLSVAGSALVIATTSDDLRTSTSWVFWWETLGVVAFGLSWFMTGRPILPKAVPIIPTDDEPVPLPAA